MFYALGIFTLAAARTAEIQTCSGCKLNRLPDLRKFIKEDVSMYSEISVRLISGQNPDFVILDDNGAESERIDLTQLDIQGLHSLIASRGFNSIKQEL